VLGSDVEPAELACRADDLDTLVLAGDDLFRRSPRPAELMATLERLRSVVVIDRFINDTLPFADVVLPSSTFAERDGTVTNVFGSVQRWNQAGPPPADCRPERVWAARIGRELDLGGWPATPRSWFEALQNQVDGYRDLSPGLLYGEQGRTPAALDQSGAPQIEARTQLRFASAPDNRAQLPDAGDAAFPMRLVLGTQPAEFSTGAVTQREELLAREARESILFASPEALEQVGVKAGWPVKVTVPGAEAVVTVRGDVRLPPDVVVLMPLAGSPPARLRGSYPGAGRRTLGLQPVPARLERA
jgi:assimilatory nitrate reductase catalytic subunit